MFHVKHYIYNLFHSISIFISHILLPHLPIPCYIPSSTLSPSHHFPRILLPAITYTRSASIPFPFSSVIILVIIPIYYHISHHIFRYPILSYHIPIPSHIVTITTYLVFNTTYNPTHIPYHVLQYYFISLLIHYVNSQLIYPLII